jgi:hypothetical protein
MEAISVEIIRVRIGSEISLYYSGFKGSYATFADSCIRKKALPGLYQPGLISHAEDKGIEMSLTLKAGLKEDDVIEFMDIALKNTGTFPSADKTEEFTIFVSNQ